MEVEIDYTKSAQDNADDYFTEAKTAKKKLAGAEQAVKRLEEKLATLENVAPKKKVLTAAREKEWYEKFYWFFASNGMLAIGGRSAQQNELINSKYFESNDLFFHASIFGASVVVLKNGVDADREVKEEVAQFAACYSKAWENGSATVDVFAAKRDQVTKSSQKGSLGTGSFLISGDREWFRSVGLGLVAYVSEEPLRLSIIPAKTAEKKKAKNSIELKPGKLKKSDIAKLIAKRFNYSELDYTIQHLPPGLFSASKDRA